MNKEELIEVFKYKTIEELEALYLIANAFNPEQLSKISVEVQDENVKNLLISYL